MKGFRKWVSMFGIIVLMGAAVFPVGCNDSDSDSGSSSASVPDFGGTIPKGDYVTAEINGDQITIANKTTGEETTLSFGDPPEESNSSILKMTEFYKDGYYLMVLLEDSVLALHKINSEMEPVTTDLPMYMFNKTSLTAEDLKGKAYNFMEFFGGADAGNLFVEVGIVGFDTDASGRLYGAAYDSEDDALYSITDEDGEADTGDEFSLDLTEPQPDGSLVLWENGVENWNAATTLTGSTSGPVVLDHGPGAGGGAGFALPQVTETDPDVFWETVEGTYFVIAYVDTGTGENGVTYIACSVRQDPSGGWGGYLYLEGTSLDEIPIEPLQEGISQDIETKADFSAAESSVVQNAAAGRGIFQQAGEDPDFLITFDPAGNYILGVKTGDGGISGFGLGIKDPDFESGAY